MVALNTSHALVTQSSLDRQASACRLVAMGLAAAFIVTPSISFALELSSMRPGAVAHSTAVKKEPLIQQGSPSTATSSLLLAQLSDTGDSSDVDDTEDLDKEVSDDTPAMPDIIDDEPDEGELNPPAPSDISSQPDTSPAEPPIQSTGRADDYAPQGPSRKIFDWSKHQGQKEVPHPFAEKGLLRIQKDGTYVYRVDESPQKTAVGVRFAAFYPENLENPDKAGLRGATFDENYDEAGSPAVLLDYEWRFWNSPIGKWGLRLGGGLYVAQGHGHFESDSNADLEPREVFTFVVVPLNVGAVFRLQLWHKQLIVPYAEGGVTAYGFSEIRDDGKSPKFGGAPASYFAVGGGLNLTYFDNFARIQLDREYGINRVYLTAEFRTSIALTDTYDFSGDMINAGFLMEY